MARFPKLSLLTLALICSPSLAQTSTSLTPPRVTVASDGAVTFPSETVPVSTLLSPEAKAYVAQHLKDMQDPSATYAEKGIPRFMAPYLVQQRAIFPVTEQDTSLDGVHVVIFSPKMGVSPRNVKRVLINLHGGGFSGCWPGCSLLESMPIASIGGYGGRQRRLSRRP